MKFQQPPIGIIVTLPRRFFEEYGKDYEDGMRRYKDDLQAMNNDEDCHWIRIMKNLPTVEDLLYVYTVYDGKVQHRTIYGGYVRDREYRFKRPFGTVKHFEHANAILQFGPVIFAPHDIPQKGFQGFRYVTEEIF
jgi:hypothetical protein